MQHTLTFHRFPKDESLRNAWIQNMNLQNWQPNPSSLLCSEHFEKHLLDFGSSRTRLRAQAIPTLFYDLPQGEGRDVTPLRRVPETSRSVTPITDPEDEETEVEVSVKEEKEYSIVIEDPLSLSSAGGSFKQLHSHQPGASHCQLYLQPSTSTTDLVIKEEIDEDLLDYKAMYYKLLDELTALKTNHQQLYQENQALIETNKTLGTEMEKLLETNQNYVKKMEQLISENQRLTEKNQSLAENIKYLSDKIHLTEEKHEENRTKERVDNFSDYIEKIENLNEKIRTLTEENKSLIDYNKNLAESVRKLCKESQIFNMKHKKQKKYIQLLKNTYNNKLEIKCNVIKALQNSLSKVKAVNKRLKQPQVAVHS